MPTLDESFAAIVAALAGHYGQPVLVGAGLDPFPALVAVLLARSADPPKVTQALQALADAGLLEPRALAETDVAEIDDALKSSGVNLAARGLAPIVRLARWIVARHHGSAEEIGSGAIATESLREELAHLNGIGPATADALLLLALRRPVYPLDRATYRILVRHGWIDPSADYDEARATVERPCPDDPDTLARLSSWLERVGRDFCRVRAPKCDRCPLHPFLPEGGPIEPEGIF
jgi:endonuclease III related protein